MGVGVGVGGGDRGGGWGGLKALQVCGGPGAPPIVLACGMLHLHTPPTHRPPPTAKAALGSGGTQDMHCSSSFSKLQAQHRPWDQMARPESVEVERRCTQLRCGGLALPISFAQGSGGRTGHALRMGKPPSFSPPDASMHACMHTHPRMHAHTYQCRQQSLHGSSLRLYLQRRKGAWVGSAGRRILGPNSPYLHVCTVPVACP